jgi:hypothetical protein
MGLRCVFMPVLMDPDKTLFLFVLYRYQGGGLGLSRPRHADSKKVLAGANYFPRKCDSKIFEFPAYVFFF